MNIIKIKHRAAFAASFLLSAFCFLLFPAPAHAQLTPVNYVNAISNVTLLIPGAKTTASNALAQGVSIRQGFGCSIMASVATTNASGTTTNLTLFWCCSQDGTNFSNLPAFSTTHNIQGVTNWISYTNIAPDILNNVAKIRILQWTNAHTDSVWLTNVMVGSRAGP